ncbi:MAG: DUF1748 domain-containing protein [archaeon]|nr:DUF1748 domain-containing protein [archaeon]
MVRPTTPPNGLFTFVFESVLVSAAISGVRRKTGLNIYEMWVKNNVTSSPVKTAIRAYLNAGEFVVDKGLEMYYSRQNDPNPSNPTQVEGRVDDQRSDSKYRY